MAIESELEHRLRATIRNVLDHELGPHPRWDDAPAARRIAERRRPVRSSWPIRLLAVAAVLGLSGAVALIGGRATNTEPATDGAFRPGPPLISGRGGHTTTLLADGRVLVLGGQTHPDVEIEVGDSAELWDPRAPTAGTQTGAFALAGVPTAMRHGHTATLLPDGRVLVVGGGFEAAALRTAESWDPATGAFSPAGTLPSGRIGHTATVLPDGRVLILGGSEPDGTPTAGVVVWDPGRGFVETGGMAEGRVSHTTTLLQDGRVLVIGGWGADSGAAELWDPASGRFSAAGSLLQPRSNHSATLLPDGRVLVVGGVDLEASLPNQNAIYLATAEWWDPASKSFSPAPSLAEARASHTATLLEDGRVLVIGGWGADRLATAEVRDPATGLWGRTGWLAEGRASHTATLLHDGRVLVVGDLRRTGSLATTQIWDPDLSPDPSENPSPSPTPPGPPPSAPPVVESDALAP